VANPTLLLLATSTMQPAPLNSGRTIQQTINQSIKIPERCRLRFGLWPLGFGLWALGFGLWALGFGLGLLFEV